MSIHLSQSVNTVKNEDYNNNSDNSIEETFCTIREVDFSNFSVNNN